MVLFDSLLTAAIRSIIWREDEWNGRSNQPKSLPIYEETACIMSDSDATETSAAIPRCSIRLRRSIPTMTPTSEK
jgi:hypothetical protein